MTDELGAIEAGTFDRTKYATELDGPPNPIVATSVVLENDRVRVWELRVEPGQRLPFHWHVTPYFFVCVDPGRVRTRFPDGNYVDMDVAVGDAWFSESTLDAPDVHDLENVGTTTVRFTTVELLDR